jgi:hypothetical protein
MATCKFVNDSGTSPSPKKPPETKKDTVVRGKAVTGLVTPASKAWKVVGLEPNLAYMADRDYNIKKFPKEMGGGHVVIRDSGQINDWVPNGQLTLAKDATLYACMLVKINDEQKISDKQLDALAADGWKFVEEPFETTTPDTSWTWQVWKRDFKKGPINPALPKEFASFRTHVIYVVK